MDNILVTICARGGSKGVKGKNICLLNGKPLIYYTIKQAIDWSKASHVVVSTDSEEIAKVAKEHGAEVPFMRPSELANDAMAKLPVIRHTLIESEKFFKEQYDMVVDLDPTSPIRTIRDLNNALELFITKKPKTLFSVVPARKNPYFNMVELNKEGRAHIVKTPQTSVHCRQDAPKVYDMNACIYFFQREFLLDETNTTVQSDNTVVYKMGELSGVDIDREIDFKFIEYLIENGFVTL